MKRLAISRLIALGGSAISIFLSLGLDAHSFRAQDIGRPLNPAPGSRSEDAADRAFRIAFEAANVGDFDTAIINYRRALMATHDVCDKTHAEAGQTAAKEAKALVRSSCTKLKANQFFWIRIQEITKGLPCVWIR